MHSQVNGATSRFQSILRSATVGLRHASSASENILISYAMSCCLNYIQSDTISDEQRVQLTNEPWTVSHCHCERECAR
jgi:hypothetical protein